MRTTYNVSITLESADNAVLENMARANGMTPVAMIQDMVIEDIHDAYIDYAEDDEED